MVTIKCTYTVEDWKEDVVEALSKNSKVTSVRAHGPVEGGIVGQVNTFYLLSYVTETEGKYTGYTQIFGRCGSREGAFLVEEAGVFDEKGVQSSMVVVPGSGTEGFEGVSGRGMFVSSHGSAVESEFELEFAESNSQT